MITLDGWECLAFAVVFVLGVVAGRVWACLRALHAAVKTVGRL